MGRFHRHDGDDAHYRRHHHHDHDHHHGHDHHCGRDHTRLTDPDDTSHNDHPGYEAGVEHMTVLEGISSENDHRVERSCELLVNRGVEAINLMSSPDSDKTALLEKTLAAAQGRLRVSTIKGDTETAFDANRLEGCGVRISLLNTGNGFGGKCHLDAPMASRTLEGLDPSTFDLVMVENVGSLICLAELGVGETRKATVYSLTGGEDKPVEYPVMFRSMQVVVINKMDLAPYLDFDMELFCTNLEKVNSGMKVIEVSAKTGEGIDR